MPEGPEVRVITDQLNAKFGGHSLLDVQVVGGRYRNNGDVELDVSLLDYPLTNVQMHCKGKFLWWEMEDPHSKGRDFLITLGMTGSFGPDTKHSALRFEFDNGELCFNDPRHFGTFKVTEKVGTVSKKLVFLGWDPLQVPGIPPHFIAGLQAKKSHKTIAEVMLNQRYFAGCGNYLRSEALFAAKIYPNTLIAQLTTPQLTNLCKCLIEIMHEAYKAGGTTLATFSAPDGSEGAYYRQLKVYGRKQDPDGREVKKLTAADGRSVWYVPELQSI